MCKLNVKTINLNYTFIKRTVIPYKPYRNAQHYHHTAKYNTHRSFFQFRKIITARHNKSPPAAVYKILSIAVRGSAAIHNDAGRALD